MTAGERIKQERERLGMTQEELAKKVGYKSRSSVNKVETCRDLSLKKVNQYAIALGVSPSYLLGWEDEIDDSEMTEVPEFEDEHLRLIELYSALSADKKKIALNILESLNND